MPPFVLGCSADNKNVCTNSCRSGNNGNGNSNNLSNLLVASVLLRLGAAVTTKIFPTVPEAVIEWVFAPKRSADYARFPPTSKRKTSRLISALDTFKWETLKRD